MFRSPDWGVKEYYLAVGCLHTSNEVTDTFLKRRSAGQHDLKNHI